jgi:hypothetical protein
MMKNNNVKKGNTAKKLLPAAGMLALSASMLATSTYAWFTMAREVDITGIQMTASVPANLQISIGNNMFNSTGEAWHQLDATITDNKLASVTVPGAADDDLDWTNSIVISDYYNFGKLTPATSISGANLWYTKDATGVGKTLKMNDDTLAATFTQANDATPEPVTVALHTSKGSGGTAATTYDSGGAYYIDIPVWFRTSSSSDVNLAVKATIKKGSSSKGTRSEADANFDLFKAARVSIIQGEASVPSKIPTGATAANEQNTSAGTVTQGVIYDATEDTTTISGKTLQSKYYAEDSHYLTGRVDTAARKTYDGLETAGWKDVVKITEVTMAGGFVSNADAADTVAVVKGSTENANYGVPCRYTIRVWIDGEDVNCWNATAAQDFIIDLSFADKANVQQ